MVWVSELRTYLADLRELRAAWSKCPCSVNRVSFWIELQRPLISSVMSSVRSYIKWRVYAKSRSSSSLW